MRKLKMLVLLVLLITSFSSQAQRYRPMPEVIAKIAAGPGITADENDLIDASVQISISGEVRDVNPLATIPGFFSINLAYQSNAYLNGDPAYHLTVGAGLFFRKFIGQVLVGNIDRHLYCGFQVEKNWKLNKRGAIVFGPQIAALINKRDRLLFNLRVGYSHRLSD